ncbi:MAG: cytochrome c [Planctomycetes bacterium]|nr:cytochrome c [Planctomycetota bacterium]
MRVLASAFLLLACAGAFVVPWTDGPGPALTDHERSGLAVWRDYNCQACHQLYGQGGFLGPDLTNAVDDTRTWEEFEALLTKGYGRMPALRLSPCEQSAVLAFLRAMNRTGRALPPRPPERTPVPQRTRLGVVADEWSRGAGRPLDENVRRGREAWDRMQCGACHAAFAEGSRREPDLSAVALDRSLEALARIVEKGHGTMPSYAVTPHELRDLRAWLDWVVKNRAELAGVERRLSGREEFSWKRVSWWEFR